MDASAPTTALYASSISSADTASDMFHVPYIARMPEGGLESASAAYPNALEASDPKSKARHKASCTPSDVIPVINPLRMQARRGLPIEADKAFSKLVLRLVDCHDFIMLAFSVAAVNAGLMGPPDAERRTGPRFFTTFWVDLGPIHERTAVRDGEQGELCLRLIKQYLGESSSDTLLLPETGPNVVNIALRRHPLDESLEDGKGFLLFRQQDYSSPALLEKSRTVLHGVGTPFRTDPKFICKYVVALS